MKVLVIGSGGREHALVWKVAQSPKVSKIYCAPGNAGIGDLAECIAIDAEDIDGLVDFAEKEQIDLTIVGPEVPLSKGIVDIFEKKGLGIFGPSKLAARLESSKSFAKALMKKYNIPAAKGESFTNYEDAEKYIKKTGVPVVVKADGLAAGKGVIICTTEDEALSALKLIIKDSAFGEAGNRVVVEEFLTGEEASFIVFTDGKTVIPLPSSQDHKAVYDGDKGPNTGGMGAYSPALVIDRYFHNKIMNEIMIPVVKGMAAEGYPYKGILYAGLMIDKDKIKVLEFNARLGDPEAQPLLMRLKSDIVPVMECVISSKLHECSLEIDQRASVCVVMTSGGYPGAYKKGFPISGLNKAGLKDDIFVFHSGTKIKDGKVIAAGGRVLGVTGLGDSIKETISKVYAAVSEISWDTVYFRKDIGKKAVKRMENQALVLIIMGSDSDLKVMEETVAVLKKFGITYEITVASAHRSPHKAMELALNAQKNGIKVIIAGAGHAAHLAGIIAAHTILPVIGVPIDSSCLQGIDALLSTLQMPPGVPVATMAVGKPGAKNAGILAVQILAVSVPELGKMLNEYKKEMALQVDKKAENLKNY